MNILNSFHRLAKPVACVLPCLLLAGAAAATEYPVDKPASDWNVARRADDGSIRMSNTVVGGTFHAVCNTKNCNLFVEPAAGCKPGMAYPLLFNSARRMGVLPGQCGLVKEGGTLHYVVRVAPSKDLLATLFSNSDFSIAFPEQSGSVSVLSIRMAGFDRLLAGALSEAVDKLSKNHKPNRPSESFSAQKRTPTHLQSSQQAAIEFALQSSRTRHQI